MWHEMRQYVMMQYITKWHGTWQDDTICWKTIWYDKKNNMRLNYCTVPFHTVPVHNSSIYLLENSKWISQECTLDRPNIWLQSFLLHVFSQWDETSDCVKWNRRSGCVDSGWHVVLGLSVKIGQYLCNCTVCDLQWWPICYINFYFQ